LLFEKEEGRRKKEEGRRRRFIYVDTDKARLKKEASIPQNNAVRICQELVQRSLGVQIYPLKMIISKGCLIEAINSE
jgi:hypothetical protein